MLVSISSNEKKITRIIYESVGKPFGLINSIRHNGTGSPRLDILKTSEEIASLLSYDNNRNYCTIELRPKGIIIRFRSLLETFALVIPYYKLVILKPGNSFTFHIDQHFISVDAPPKNKAVNSFIDKINLQKSENSPLNIEDL